jgi:large subunit ribosomal protein L15
MKIENLIIEKKKNKKRVGRGISAGGGKTAGRGTKGQRARTGKKIRLTFEGGQTPLVRRIPKNRGFRSLATRYQNVYLETLGAFSGKVDNFKLAEAGLIDSAYVRTKIILGKKEVKNIKVELSSQKISAGALKKLEECGGKFVSVATPRYEKSKREKKLAKEQK